MPLNVYDHDFAACPYPKGCTGCESISCYKCDATGWLTSWDDETGELLAHYDDADCPWCDGRGRVTPDQDRKHREGDLQEWGERNHP